ncbi:hypothetical protein LguiA_027996 [Lonicera macranthoides]
MEPVLVPSQQSFELAIDLMFRWKAALENKLYWQILPHGDEDAYIYRTVNDAKVELINFAGALINSHQSPDKLFKLLDLCNLLVDICPPLTFMTFSEPTTEEFEEAELILGFCFQPVEVVRGILSDF